MILLAIEDITERRRAEGELAEHGEHLEELVRERTSELEDSNEKLRREMSDRKQAEEALRRTQFTVDRSGDSVFWLTPEARIVYANDEACRRRGYTKDEMLSMSMFELNVDIAADPSLWERVRDRLRESDRFASEFRHRCKDGSLFPVEATLNRFEFEGRDIRSESA